MTTRDRFIPIHQTAGHEPADEIKRRWMSGACNCSCDGGACKCSRVAGVNVDGTGTPRIVEVECSPNRTDATDQIDPVEDFARFVDRLDNVSDDDPVTTARREHERRMAGAWRADGDDPRTRAIRQTSGGWKAPDEAMASPATAARDSGSIDHIRRKLVAAARAGGLQVSERLEPAELLELRDKVRADLMAMGVSDVAAGLDDLGTLEAAASALYTGEKYDAADDPVDRARQAHARRMAGAWRIQPK